MYNKKLVATIKSGGKIMREDGETVYLPFGNEYSVLIKNLNNVRALVNVEIDGVDAIDGGLIVNANQTVDLERFLCDNMNEGAKFKFIEKTEQISDHRGDKIEDGIIRVTYQFEAPFTPVLYPITYNYDPWDTGKTSNPKVYGGGTFSSSSLPRNINTTLGDAGTNVFYSQNFNVGASVDGVKDSEQEVYCSGNIMRSANDAGITVHGGKSTQKFQHGTMGMLEFEKHVICLNLKGFVGSIKVKKPVTVNRTITCNTCGTKSSTTQKFCGKCGTNLTYQY